MPINNPYKGGSTGGSPLMGLISMVQGLAGNGKTPDAAGATGESPGYGVLKDSGQLGMGPTAPGSESGIGSFAIADQSAIDKKLQTQQAPDNLVTAASDPNNGLDKDTRDMLAHIGLRAKYGLTDEHVAKHGMGEIKGGSLGNQGAQNAGLIKTVAALA